MQPAESLLIDFDPAQALWRLGCLVEGAAQAVLIEQGKCANVTARGEPGAKGEHDMDSGG